MDTDPDDRRGASHHRDVAPAEMATLLRAVLGLDPHRPLPEERAADLRRPMPATIHDVATGPWIAWCLIGLTLFVGPKLPTYRAVIAAAKRVIVAIAMLRSDSISRSSVLLGVSRRTLREAMRAAELHPWRRGRSDEHGPPVHPLRCEPGSLPEAAEDGTAGTVQFEPRNDEGAGPSWLVRGDRRDLLFRGAWSDAATARAYARSHGHAFELIGGGQG